MEKNKFSASLLLNFSAHLRLNWKRLFVFFLLFSLAGGDFVGAQGIISARRHSVLRKDLHLPLKVTIRNLKMATHLLPTQRLISPVGILNRTPNFPTNVKIFGDYIAVLTNGARKIQYLILYNRKTLKPVAEIKAYRGNWNQPYTGRVIQFPQKASRRFKNLVGYSYMGGNMFHVVKTSVPATNLKNQSFYQGLAVSKNGTLYAAGGITDNVIAIRLIHGYLRVVKNYRLTYQPFPKTQYPYEYQGHQTIKPYLFYPDAVALAKNGKFLYVTGLLSNSLAKINLATGKVKYVNAGAYPIALSLTDQGEKVVVCDWGADEVRVFDSRSLKFYGKVPFSKHLSTRASFHPLATAAIPGTDSVAVCASNVDRLYLVDARKLKIEKVLSVSPYSNAPYGSYPDGVSVSDHLIFVSNAGNNDVEVFNARNDKEVGLIPTAWYPTSMTSSARSLYITNAKGLGAGPNLEFQWIGAFMHGALQKVSIKWFLAHAERLTQIALSNNGFTTAQRTKRQMEENRTVQFLRRHIKHVIFILRENKTFDEDFGSYKRAGEWADPKLDLYNQNELPNLYQLANHYALFTNFYADGEVTAQGHEWTTGASDSDFVQRTWPMYYSGRGLVPNPGWTQALRPFRLNEYNMFANSTYWGPRSLEILHYHMSNPWISYPYGLYLFNNLSAHHISFEDFGEFVSHSRNDSISKKMKSDVYEMYPAWNRYILDTTRAKIFLHWAKNRLQKNDFPQFTYIWLPDDHTAGATPCYYTPQYYVANNDLAAGRIISFISHSKIWKNTLIFITEDDAQSGADHISAHRTFALMIGPWVRKGALVQERYSQVSIMATIEKIFHVPPMSQWDANAKVIINGFTRHPNFKPLNFMLPDIPKALNPGSCSPWQRLKLKLGSYPSGATKEKSLSRVQIPRKYYYSPVTLMKIPGRVQFAEGWIAVKGIKSYEKVKAYIQKLAEKQGAPVQHFLQ